MPHTALNQWLKKAGWVKRVEPSAPLPDDPHLVKLRVAEQVAEGVGVGESHRSGAEDAAL